MSTRPSAGELIISCWVVPMVLVELAFHPSMVFPDIDSIPLPDTVRQRIHLLDLIEPSASGISYLDTACPGVYGKRSLWGPLYGDSRSYEGRWAYELELTKTEYDQLVAALGGEESDA